MVDDFARAVGASRSMVIDGKQYLVSKLTPRGLGDLQAFFKDVVPDPRDVARQRMDGLPDSVQIRMWELAWEAAKSWPPGFGDPDTLPLLLSEEGQARLLWVAMRSANPGFTLDAARELSARVELGQDQVERLMELLSPGELGDPKVPATTTPD